MPSSVDPTWWDLVSGAAIPSLAIVISTSIAVWLAMSERKHAAKARATELSAASEARRDERRAARDDREMERRDRHLEELLEVFGFFISAHPTTESWSPTMRKLRAKLVILQTISSTRPLAEWLVSEGPRGQQAMQLAMANPYLEVPEDPEYLKWQGPMANWAQEMINGIASWMRGDVSDAELLETTKKRARTAAQDGLVN